MKPNTRTAAVNFIFITLLLDVIGFGIIIPVLPELLSEMKGIGVNEASKYGGYLIFSFAAAQFLFSPVVGNLSDQVGRRPVLLASLLAFTGDYLILALAPDYTWFLVGRILSGMTGASFTTGAAYIADVSTVENRSKNFGMIGAAFGLGFIIGPMIGGFLGHLGLRVPFYFAAGLSFVNFLYGYFILPESLPEEHRRKFSWRRANPKGTLMQLSKYKKILVLLSAFVFLHLGSHAIQSNWSYFTIYRFEWSEAMVGLSLAFAGLLVGLVQAVLAPKAALRLGLKQSIYIGFALYSFGMFLFVFASASWMMFMFLVPYCLGGIAAPNLQSYMTSEVPKNQQGELQGGLTSLVSLTAIVGPLVMTGAFYHFTKDNAPVYFPAAPFLLGGIFMFIGFVICYLTLREKKLQAF